MSGHEQSFISRYIFSTDHKVIGKQYSLVGIIMAFFAGYLAYTFRMQLAFPEATQMDGQDYNARVTLHGMIMFFWVAMPILLAGSGNLLIPVMTGCDDMAFPKLNMMSFWIFFLSTVVLIASFFTPTGAYGGGWTIYPPLSANAYMDSNPAFLENLFSGIGLLILAVALEFVSMLMGGINFLVTTINKRAPGLKPFEMPIFLWMINLASVDFMFSVGPLIAGAVMLLFDVIMGTGFYDPARGGDPILFQHLFWFFGHPEVYVVFLPTLGIVAEIITTQSRKPIFAYKIIVWSAIISVILSLIVWAHHQFVSGIDVRMANFFSITTIMISIPFAAIFFAYIFTLYKGSITYSTGMLFALGFLFFFLVGGVTGIFLGSSAFDIYAHDSYFVVAHFHYTLIPIVFYGALSGMYHWFPKFYGKRMNEGLGKLHFILTSIFFNLLFFPLFYNGMMGQHRRIYDYSKFESMMTPDLIAVREFATYMTIGLIASQLIFVVNFIMSWMGGEEAGKNPWKSAGLEWTTDSPPPHGNWTSFPTVYRGPYEYSRPDREQDYWPQDASS